MPSNRGVVYLGPGKVDVQNIDFPTFRNPAGIKIEHGVILKVVATNICGSDQHMVRGRTTAPAGMVLGHEITGEIIEIGRDVEYLRKGDVVSVPFNVACGRCRTCREGDTGVCLNVNPERASGAYGYVDMGGWIGGQAEYVMVPYADFNCLKFPDKAQALEKIRDLTCLTDILPTGFHGAVTAKVGVGSTVYVAGAGPVGLAAAGAARILGAAVVLIGDLNRERLAHARKVGFEPIDLSAHDRLGELVADVLGVPEVDCAIDCVGFEAKGQGSDGHVVEAPAVVLNGVMEITRPAGSIGIPGLYVTDDPGAKEKAAQQGMLSLRFGLGWAKSHSLHTGQTPVLKYNRQLMQAFTVTHDITRFTKAKIFSAIGKQTPMFARFSTVAGERGAADAERDIRGTALKFYTEEGNWDIVGNNTPVFFFRDPLRFPDLNHAIKRDPRTGLRSADNNWDFWTLLPEALHQVTITMSDRGIPKSFRHMHLYGSHTFSMINAANGLIWVKFHFRTQQGIANLTDAEAEALVAKDRESNGRDLLNAIDTGDFPRWTLFIQVMTDAQARTHKHNPFDLTKVWSQKEYPLIEVGVMELNRYPENYFAEVEQAAFSPANIVPGIGFSPDKMLQGRLFSYGDTQRYRLGINFNHIPVNAPKCPFMSYHRDGKMRTDGNLGGTLTFNPNSDGLWDNQPDFAELPMPVDGDGAHYDHRVDDDHWEQPGNLFRLMTPDQQQRLFENTARAMGDARRHIKERHVANCLRADPAYGAGVARALGLKGPGFSK